MITKDIYGNTLGSDYAAAVKEDNRDFLARFMLSGSELNCGIKRLEVTKGCCGDSSQFSVGSVVGSMLTAEVLELNDDVKGQTLDVQVGLLVGQTRRWISIGTFIISEVKKNLYGSTLTGYSAVVANSAGKFNEPSTKTIRNILDELKTELGVSSFSYDVLIDDSKVINESMAGLSTYQAMQIVASCVGGFVMDRADGYPSLRCFYDNPPQGYLNVEPEMMVTLPDLSEQNFEITGVECIVKDESEDSDGNPILPIIYSSGSPINYTMTNPYMTQNLFNDMASHLIGYEYRAGNINLSLGDPRLEANDVLSVTDVDESVYIVPCHIMRHIYDGGWRTEITAVPATNIENNIGSTSPFEDFQKETNQNIVTLGADIQNLYEGIQYFWKDSAGAHVATVSETQYNNGTACNEVLITSSQMIFRHLNSGHSTITNYAVYGSSGITLGQYASMTSSGIILGDINDLDYQLKLDPERGIYLSGKLIAVSEYATGIIAEQTTVDRVVSGLVSDDSYSVEFTVPLECIMPEGLSINMSLLYANFILPNGSCIDSNWVSGGSNQWMFNRYTMTAVPAGAAMTVTVTGTNKLKVGNTSTVVSPHTPVVVEVCNLQWTKPAA